MDERDTEILRSAKSIHDRPDSQGHAKEGWFKPMHIGAWDASYHSNRLRALAKLGLIEKRWWGRAYAYRITPAGVDAITSTRGAKA